MRGRDNKAGSVFEGPIPMQTAAALKGKRGKKILASHGHNQGTEIKKTSQKIKAKSSTASEARLDATVAPGQLVALRRGFTLTGHLSYSNIPGHTEAHVIP